jgi:hypothetical protein
MFCVYVRTNSEFYPTQQSVIGFYNRDGKCLLRGTTWVFKYSGLPFVLKGLIYMISQKRSLSHISGSAYSASGARILKDAQFVYSAVTGLGSTFYLLAFIRDIPTNNVTLNTCKQ